MPAGNEAHLPQLRPDAAKKIERKKESLQIQASPLAHFTCRPPDCPQGWWESPTPVSGSLRRKKAVEFQNSCSGQCCLTHRGHFLILVRSPNSQLFPWDLVSDIAREKSGEPPVVRSTRLSQTLPALSGLAGPTQ